MKEGMTEKPERDVLRPPGGNGPTRDRRASQSRSAGRARPVSPPARLAVGAVRNLRVFTGIPSTVIALGMVSLFTDLSSEMIYPLLPVFLSSVLGASAIALGLIEGVAESTAALLKVVSGMWSDRSGRRKAFVLGGYALSCAVRPLIGLAASWTFVLAMRFSDRVGKGARTSPRDALIADVTPAKRRGIAFGFHRSMDHAGAVLGPLVGVFLLNQGIAMRNVFLISAIPAVVVISILILGVREPRMPRGGTERKEANSHGGKAGSLIGGWKELGADFKTLLVALILFTLGNSTDAFLLLRLSDSGISATMVAGLWSLHHVIKMIATYAGGALSDRIGRRRSVLAGWLLYAAVYLAFAVADSPASMVTVFMVYGIYYGLTEPSERAWVADLVPEIVRGSAFGYYHGTIAIGALPASLLFGLVWHSFGAPAAFVMGSVLALLASGLLTRVRTAPAKRPPNRVPNMA